MAGVLHIDIARVLCRVVKSGIIHQYMLYIGVEGRNTEACFIREGNYSDLILALGAKECVLEGSLFKTHSN